MSLAVAAVKHSCVSILESFVSKYENHFDECRNADETTANEKFTIVVKGPKALALLQVIPSGETHHRRERGLTRPFTLLMHLDLLTQFI